MNDTTVVLPAHRILSRRTLFEFVRYATIGIVAASSDLFFLYFLTHSLGIWSVPSAGVSYLIGLVLVFLLNKIWAFNNRALVGVQLTKFLALAAVNYAVVLLLMFLFTEHFRIQYLVAKCIVIALQVCWNFVAYKYWIFKTL